MGYKRRNGYELRETTNSSVFTKAARMRLRCPICPPNRGENSDRGWCRSRKSWKRYRKTRWKPKK